MTETLSPELIPMAVCTEEGAGKYLAGWEGLKSELSMTCEKGHPSVTPPLNILLNDVPRLLTPADKARKHYTVRRAPPRLLLSFFSIFSPHSLSLSLCVSARHLVLPQVEFLIIKKRILAKVFQLFLRLCDPPGPGCQK